MEQKLNTEGFDLIQNLKICDLNKGDLVAFFDGDNALQVGVVDRRFVPDAVLVRWPLDSFLSTETDHTLYKSIFPIKAKEKMKTTDELILEAEEALRVLLEKKRNEAEEALLDRVYNVPLTGNQIQVMYEITGMIAGCPKTTLRKYTDQVGEELLAVLSEHGIPTKHIHTNPNYQTIQLV